jgi:hypothetical protein
LGCCCFRGWMQVSWSACSWWRQNLNRCGACHALRSGEAANAAAFQEISTCFVRRSRPLLHVHLSGFGHAKLKHIGVERFPLQANACVVPGWRDTG